jgi:UDP-2,3-diacylglucosamine pyrophosphatase LpxH
MSGRVSFSDLHFGDPDCSLKNPQVETGICSFLSDLGEVDEFILVGDILDANISSLTRAIEGKRSTGGSPGQIGFRRWFAHLFEGDGFDAKGIVSIPGNHDYIIWNILSTYKAFVDPISQGRFPTNLPLTEGDFPQPFIRGIAPEKVRDRFRVVYPDFEFDLAGRFVLVTHGHYLDEQQTLFTNLDEPIRLEDGNKKEAIRKFFIGTAQYQALANAVSYLKTTRHFVEVAYKTISSIFDAIGKLMDKPIDETMLKAIEMYLYYFRDKQPDVFVFGHTHKAGHSNTNTLGSGGAKRLIPKDIEVWNDSSFLGAGSKGRVGTFILTEDYPADDKPIRILEVNPNGVVKEMDV